MRFGSLLLVVLVLTAGSALASNKKPDLVVKSATAAAAANRHVAVDVTVANKGKKKAKPSKAGIYLSADADQDITDTGLGTIDVPKLKPGKSRSVSGNFTIPASVANGTYRVIACADDDDAVKEKKEGNQCKAATGSVVLTPPPPPPKKVSVAAVAGSGGSVAASSISGGTCTGTSCSLNSGASSVTFTPTPSETSTFGSWSGATCFGYLAGPGNAITFTNPTTAKACTANFDETFTISWNNYLSWGSVSGCGGAFSTAVSGSCQVAEGATTQISAKASSSSFVFDHWGENCDGTASTAGSGADRVDTMTFTNVHANHTCDVYYAP